jgi:hypothetical protein
MDALEDEADAKNDQLELLRNWSYANEIYAQVSQSAISE